MSDNNKQMERISTARTRLLARIPFFGHLALKLRPRLAKEQDGVPTAAVSPDGTLVFNEKFMETLDDAELAFVLAHEVLHPALLYFERLQSRIPKLFNIAHDYAINLIIQEMGDATIKVLDDALLDTKYKDWSAEEIYDELLKNTRIVNICQSGQGQPQNQNQKGKQKGQGGQGNTDPLADPLFGDGRPDLSDSEDGKKAAKGDKGAQDRLATEWKISVVAAAQKHEEDKGRGSLPGALSRLIEEIVNPKVDWQEQLRRWVGENGRRQDYTFARPSRRSESIGQYMPSIKKHGVDDVAILMDTSGSISHTMLKEGVSEVAGICEDLGIGVRALSIDADVHADVECDEIEDFIDSLSGGGGSDFNPGFKRLVETGFTGVVIAFTDGDIWCPEEKPEQIRAVLWVTYAGCRRPVSWGEWIEIPRE